jgi:hypothetical protein
MYPALYWDFLGVVINEGFAVWGRELNLVVSGEGWE